MLLSYFYDLKGAYMRYSNNYKGKEGLIFERYDKIVIHFEDGRVVKDDDVKIYDELVKKDKVIITIGLLFSPTFYKSANLCIGEKISKIEATSIEYDKEHLDEAIEIKHIWEGDFEIANVYYWSNSNPFDQGVNITLFEMI